MYLSAGFFIYFMRNINSSKLTKQYILEKISQITIFSTYLAIPNDVIQHCIDTGELICSPIRDDVHPTCGFRYDNRGKLKFKDFSGHFWGDCFDVVALIMSGIYNKQYDISNKNDFVKILRHITFTFKDVFYGKEKDINLINEINVSIANIKHKKPNIELVVRKWNEDDKRYWEQFGVSLQYLNLNFIHPIEQYYINRKVNPEPKYFYKANDPCYAYVLGQDRSGIYNIKLYFPNREKGVTRFITNCNHLEGIYNLDKTGYDIIVITKSTKDRVSIGNNLLKIDSLYGVGIANKIGLINIPHETYKLRQNEYDWLKSKLSNKGIIVSLMDNDRVGKMEAKWLKYHFNILPIIIPKHYNAKDFAELINKHKLNNITPVIIDTINKIKEYEHKSMEHIRDKTSSNIVPF